MRVLFLSRWLPYPIDNGSRLRIHNLLKGIASRHRVTLLAFNDQPARVSTAAAICPMCEVVETIPWREFRPASPRALLAALAPAPRSIADTYSGAMASAVQRHIAQGYDVVVASQWPTMPYARLWDGVPAIMEEVELGAIDELSRGDRAAWHALRYRLTRLKMRSYVAKSVKYFRAYTVVSQVERDLLSTVLRDRRIVKVVPNGVDVQAYTGIECERPPDSLVFTGSLTFSANLDAVQYFLTDVFPLVRQAAPAAQITITGRAPDGPLVPTLSSPGVNYLGYVADVRPVVGASAVSVAPVRSGGGTRLKILEAMALGTPVVSTSKGAEGLDAADGEHLLIGDTPESFAAHVVRLLNDESLRERLAINARELVRKQYDWSVIMPSFLSLLEDVA